MARSVHTPDLSRARQNILNKLCVLHRVSTYPGYISANELRENLGMPKDIFMEAIDSLSKTQEQMAVEVFMNDNILSLRLGAAMRELCSGWSLVAKEGVFPNRHRGNVNESRRIVEQTPTRNFPITGYHR